MINAEIRKYRSRLNLSETQRAIRFLKIVFENYFSNALNLLRVSAPVMVDSNSGVQDDLNGTERPVSFKVRGIGNQEFEIVHSLAKWKRLALSEYSIETGKGIYTDMNAIRPDEEDLRTGIHSIYVDQWDWEKVMSLRDRNLAYLKDTVKKIYDAIKKTEIDVCRESCHNQSAVVSVNLVFQ